ncbi:ATP-binding protein [Lysinibacillus sp. KU-BSD001]|uniref:ATP-binding protein n=1 Tax=Lysinibacillus sp. KU-BSD001 TaxID=3141328 RepID=UPI0036E8BC89
MIKIQKSPSPFFVTLLIALLTAIGSEIKIMPFDEAPFRFGLGSIIFFLAILVRPVSIIKAGIATSITVFLFRTGLDLLLYKQSFQLFEHIPAALFYITFAICLRIVNINNIRTRPFHLGLYGALFEVIANTVEQLSITVFITGHFITAHEYMLFLAVAILRSYFVVGLFSTLAISEQKKRNEQLLSIGADLYVETLYLQKSMEQIEKITANAFDLYKQLKSVDHTLSLKALILSQEIHELKKDSQRIYAGLSKITTAERSDTYTVSDLLRFITQSNMRYSEHLHKTIDFEVILNEDFHTKEHILLLAMLNNIVANAIEAIDQQGIIKIEMLMTVANTTFIIENNGPPIPEYVLPVIFDPGYTTKFTKEGNPSTGIGLSHVQTMVHRLEGVIDVSSNESTIFTIIIPTYKLI